MGQIERRIEGLKRSRVGKGNLIPKPLTEAYVSISVHKAFHDKDTHKVEGHIYKAQINTESL